MPLPQVTAPALAMPPLSQFGFATTKLPFESAVTIPPKSLAVEPRNVLIRAPVEPLNRYTAPAFRPPASSKGDVMTTLPVLSGTTVVPNPLLAAGFGSTNSGNVAACSAPPRDNVAQHRADARSARRVSLSR